LAVIMTVLALGGCASGGAAQHSGEQSAPEVEFTIQVRLLPEADIVDKTGEELPLLPGAVVTVVELGLQRTADANGEVRFALPLGTTPGFGEDEGAFTFDVSVDGSVFHTTVRRRVTVYEPCFAIEYNPSRDVHMDLIAPREPQQTPVSGHAGRQRGGGQDTATASGVGLWTANCNCHRNNEVMRVPGYLIAGCNR